jgi:DNA-binding MarR family transcriptional regulator
VFAEVGLTPTQFGVLVQLEDREPRTQADLARGVLLRPQSMGELVESLLARGLVGRDGPGGRGRRVGIRLTEGGRALLAAAWPRVRPFNALDELLHRVRHALGGPAGAEGEPARDDG